ncbi:MAG: branched-chain amino acid ABC transporter permease [Chloroflexi bacterium]|nr:branched-chain amino acid ABC transporter permease [Chloroflexota bacterium]
MPDVTLAIAAQILIIGLANGAVIALIALGYTLVYGIVELINFAHGEVFMLSAFFALSMVNLLGLGAASPGVLAAGTAAVLIATMAFGALLNLTIERLAYRPLRNAPKLAPLITAIGVSFILVNLGLLWYGPRQVRFPDLLPDTNLLTAFLGEGSVFRVSVKEVFVLGLTAPLLIGLHLFITRTKLGKAMRATAQNREAAALMGIDVNRTIAIAFLLGGMLAGSAALISGMYTNSTWFMQGFRAGLAAFTAAVFGGIGNPTGAALGGIILGVLSAASDYLIDPKWTQVVVFGLLVLVLTIRPSGLLGDELPERA